MSNYVVTPLSAASSPVDAVMSQAQTANPNQKPPDVRAPDVEGWEAIRGSESPALFEQFLKEYPDSQYAGAARLKLAVLRNSKARTSTSSAPPDLPAKRCSGAETSSERSRTCARP
jgi:hypothetical protein